MTPSANVQSDLDRYLAAGVPMILITTLDETQADQYISEALREYRDVLEWNGSDGLVHYRRPREPVLTGHLTLEQALEYLGEHKRDLDHSALVLRDIGSLLDAASPSRSARVVAQLSAIVRRIRKNQLDTTVILIAPELNIPRELMHAVTVLPLALPAENELRNIITDFTAAERLAPCEPALQAKLADAMKGLTATEAHDLLSLAVVSFGSLTEDALALIHTQKQQIVLKEGLLEMIPSDEDVERIGGLQELRSWLKKKAVIFSDPRSAQDFGVDTPKGVLIVGMPGCGKSLSAKAAAHLFKTPLLRLDIGRLMGKYVGESESNLRRAIQLAEAISPCVLWIDELEKAFAGIGDSDVQAHESTTRLFGTLLTWMQEKQAAVFVVATANDVSKLPPELQRKGRFDEIFCVACPNRAEREEIFRIHLQKRRPQDVSRIDLKELAEKTMGYTGADIEGVVSASVERAFTEHRPAVRTEDLLAAVRSVRPLSETNRAQFEKMKKIFKESNFRRASRDG